MKMFKRLKRDEQGAAVIELAFGFPILVMLIWMVIQLGLVFRAMSGIQHALGEGARLATVWPVSDVDIIKDKMDEAVFGIGPGDFDIPEPTEGTADGSEYLDLEVTYIQKTDLIFIPGPTITVSREKRVWLAENDT